MPLALTTNSVVDAPVLEVEPIAKSVWSTEVEAAWSERSAYGELEPIPTCELKSAVPPTLRMELMVEEPVTASALVVALVRETKPPLTALKMPPMVVDAVTASEPEVVALPKRLLPSELNALPTVVEPKIETSPALVRVKSVVVAEVAEVEATAMRNWL